MIIRKEFPELSKQGISNILMFQDNFESLDETLISFRSLALALNLVGLTGNQKKDKGQRTKEKGKKTKSCKSIIL